MKSVSIQHHKSLEPCLKQENKYSIIGIAIFTIVALGSLAALGWGVGGVGAYKGWWSSATLLGFGESNSWLLIIMGTGVTICAAIVFGMHFSNRQKNVGLQPPKSQTLKIQNEFLPIYQELLAWVNKIQGNEQSGRKACVAAIMECLQNRSSSLNMNGLFLTEIPTSLCSLTHLKVLHLGHNFLKSLPSEFDQLKNLSECDLSNNELKEVPDCLYALKQLKILDLSFNKISDITEDILSLPKLKQLNLRYNAIALQPKAFDKLNAKVNYEKNPFTSNHSHNSN